MTQKEKGRTEKAGSVLKGKSQGRNERMEEKIDQVTKEGQMSGLRPVNKSRGWERKVDYCNCTLMKQASNETRVQPQTVIYFWVGISSPAVKFSSALQNWD